MSSTHSSKKPWPVADVAFVEVQIQNPRERQMHIFFENDPRLVIGGFDQIPLAAELTRHLRKIERTQKGGRS